MKTRTKKSSTITGCKPVLRQAVGLFVAVFAFSAFAMQTDLSAKRQSELRYILQQDCGSCHGLTLKGGLGPALTLEQMQDRDESDLVAVILDGVPGTPMPPWRPLLSEQEAAFMAQVLKSGDMVQ